MARKPSFFGDDSFFRQQAQAVADPLAAWRATLPEPPPPSEESEFTKGMKLGFSGMETDIYRAGEAAAGLVGWEAAQQRLAKERQLAEEEQAQLAPLAVPSYKGVTDLRSALQYAAGGLGTLVPSALTMVAGGMGGKLLGGGLGALAGRSMAAAGRGAKIGEVAGSLAASAAPQAGAIVAENPEAPGMSLAGGLAAGALDILPYLRAMKVMRGVPNRVVEGKIAPLGTELIKQMGTEAGTEVLQEVIAKTVDVYNDPTKSMWSEQAKEDYINSALLGALGGGVLGGGMDVAGRLAQRVLPGSTQAPSSLRDAQQPPQTEADMRIPEWRQAGYRGPWKPLETQYPQIDALGRPVVPEPSGFPSRPQQPGQRETLQEQIIREGTDALRGKTDMGVPPMERMRQQTTRYDDYTGDATGSAYSKISPGFDVRTVGYGADYVFKDNQPLENAVWDARKSWGQHAFERKKYPVGSEGWNLHTSKMQEYDAALNKMYKEREYPLPYLKQEYAQNKANSLGASDVESQYDAVPYSKFLEDKFQRLHYDEEAQKQVIQDVMARLTEYTSNKPSAPKRVAGESDMQYLGKFWVPRRTSTDILGRQRGAGLTDEQLWKTPNQKGETVLTRRDDHLKLLERKQRGMIVSDGVGKLGIDFPQLMSQQMKRWSNELPDMPEDRRYAFYLFDGLASIQEQTPLPRGVFASALKMLPDTTLIVPSKKGSPVYWGDIKAGFDEVSQAQGRMETRAGLLDREAGTSAERIQQMNEAVQRHGDLETLNERFAVTERQYNEARAKWQALDRRAKSIAANVEVARRNGQEARAIRFEEELEAARQETAKAAVPMRVAEEQYRKLKADKERVGLGQIATLDQTPRELAGQLEQAAEARDRAQANQELRDQIGQATSAADFDPTSVDTRATVSVDPETGVTRVEYNDLQEQSGVPEAPPENRAPVQDLQGREIAPPPREAGELPANFVPKAQALLQRLNQGRGNAGIKNALQSLGFPFSFLKKGIGNWQLLREGEVNGKKITWVTRETAQQLLDGVLTKQVRLPQYVIDEIAKKSETAMPQTPAPQTAEQRAVAAERQQAPPTAEQLAARAEQQRLADIAKTEDRIDQLTENLQNEIERVINQPDAKKVAVRDANVAVLTRALNNAKAELERLKANAPRAPIQIDPATQNAAKPELPETGNQYLAKDKAKWAKANKFIGRGSPASSTAKYAKALGSLANSGNYSASDVVFVSAEGNRANRAAPNYAEIRRALEAGAKIITDDAANRNRAYNVGEREVAAFLQKNGYVETASGEWVRNREADSISLENVDPEIAAGMRAASQNFSIAMEQPDQSIPKSKWFAKAPDKGVDVNNPRIRKLIEGLGLDELIRDTDQSPWRSRSRDVATQMVWRRLLSNQDIVRAAWHADQNATSDDSMFSDSSRRALALEILNPILKNRSPTGNWVELAYNIQQTLPTELEYAEQSGQFVTDVKEPTAEQKARAAWKGVPQFVGRNVQQDLWGGTITAPSLAERMFEADGEAASIMSEMADDAYADPDYKMPSYRRVFAEQVQRLALDRGFNVTPQQIETAAKWFEQPWTPEKTVDDLKRALGEIEPEAREPGAPPNDPFVDLDVLVQQMQAAWDNQQTKVETNRLDAFAQTLSKLFGLPTVKLMSPTELLQYYRDQYATDNNPDILARARRAFTEENLRGRYLFPMPDGTQRIWVKPTSTMTSKAWTLTHEVGHGVFRTYYNDASNAMKAALDAEWQQHVERLKTDPTKAHWNAMQFNLGTLLDGQTNMLTEDFMPYATDFEEWMANRIQGWVAKNAEPRTLIDQFFKGIADKLKQLYDKVRQEFGYDISPTVEQFIEDIIRQHGDATVLRQQSVNITPPQFTGALKRQAAFIERSLNKLAGLRTQQGGGGGRDGARVLRAMDDFAEPNMTGRSAEALIDALKEVLKPAELQLLGRAARTPAVLNQIRRAFQGHEQVLTQIDLKKPVENANYNPADYAIAYMMMLRAAGVIEVGPETLRTFKSFHGRVQELWKKLTGVRSAAEQLQTVFEGFTNQGILDRARGGTWELPPPLREKLLHRAMQKAMAIGKRARTRLYDPIMGTAQERLMATNIPQLQYIAQIFAATSYGSAQSGSFHEDVRLKLGEVGRQIRAALGDNLENDDFMRDLSAAVNNPDVLRIADPEVQRAVQALKDNVFKPFLNYMRQRGLKVEERANYFPWFIDNVAVNRVGDEAIMQFFAQRHFLPHWEKLAARMQERKARLLHQEMTHAARDKDMFLHEGRLDIDGWQQHLWQLAEAEAAAEPVTPSEAMGRVLDQWKNQLNIEIVTDEAELLHNPKMGFINARELDFLQNSPEATADDRAFLAQLFFDDARIPLATYMSAGAKRAEYAVRFGENGENLWDRYEREQTLRDPARREHGKHRRISKGLLDEARRAGATEEQIELAKAYINAQLGMGGIDTKKQLDALITWSPLPKRWKKSMMQGVVIHPKLQRAFGWMTVYQNYRLLGLSPLSSLIDPLGIAVRGNDMVLAIKGIKDAMKALADQSAGEPNSLLWLADMLGATDRHLLADAIMQRYMGPSHYQTPMQAKLNDALFKGNMMIALTRFSRLAAVSAAKGFIKRHVVEPIENSQRYLDELGLRPGDVQFDEAGELKVLTDGERMQAEPEEYARDERVRRALFRFVEQSIIRPDASQRPLYFSDPHFQLFSYLRSFMYSFHERILKRVATEAIDHGNVGPLIIMMASYLPVMIMADALRDLIQHGGEAPWKRAWGVNDYLAWSAKRAGFMGKYEGLAEDWEEHLGIAANQAIDWASSRPSWEQDIVRALPLNNIYRGWFNTPKWAKEAEARGEELDKRGDQEARSAT